MEHFILIRALTAVRVVDQYSKKSIPIPIPLKKFYSVDVIVPGLFHITVLFLKQLNIWFVCL